LIKTVVGLFDSRDQAEKAVSALRSAGFNDEISILAADKNQDKNQAGDNTEYDQTTMNADNDLGMGKVTAGASTGGVLGGLAGLAMGAGALAIPGIGPVIAAGPIAGLLSGAATGGVAGSLIDWGIPAERGRFYEGKVREGKIMASVRSDENKINQAADILRQNGAQDVETH